MGYDVFPIGIPFVTETAELHESFMDFLNFYGKNRFGDEVHPNHPMFCRLYTALRHLLGLCCGSFDEIVTPGKVGKTPKKGWF